MIKFIFFIGIVVSISCRADEVVAVLDLKFLTDTEEPSGFMCFDEQNEQCEVWSTFYLFKAKVKKRVSGELPDKFKVIWGVHALKKGGHKSIVARLKKLDSHATADYQIIAVGEALNLYCFISQESTPMVVNEVGTDQKFGCYE